MKISEGILFSDFQICLQSISEDMAPNNSATIITTTGITITYKVYFLVMHTGNHTVMLELGQLLQEMRLHRLPFRYSLSSMPLPHLLAKFFFVDVFCFLLQKSGVPSFLPFSFLP